jgi:hypothetical protein
MAVQAMESEGKKNIFFVMARAQPATTNEMATKVVWQQK